MPVYLEQQAQVGISIISKSLGDKPSQFMPSLQNMNVTDLQPFQASKGWFQGCKCCHSLERKLISGETVCTIVGAAEKSPNFFSI